MSASAPSPKKLTVIEIQGIVARYFKMPVEDLFLKTRNLKVVRPRQIGMALSLQYTTASTTRIAHMYGLLCHTTAMHARDSLPKTMKVKPKVEKYFLEIKQLIEEQIARQEGMVVLSEPCADLPRPINKGGAQHESV